MAQEANAGGRKAAGNRAVQTGGESGRQLSVKPENLARALTAWKYSDASEPQLLDRLRAMLRGR